MEKCNNRKTRYLSIIIIKATIFHLLGKGINHYKEDINEKQKTGIIIVDLNDRDYY